MEFWAILGSIGSIVGGACSFFAIANAYKEYKINVKNEVIRATLENFPKIRSDNGELILKISDLENAEGRKIILKKYLSQMEHFAVGINQDAYDIDIVDKMSGGMLISQYEEYIKDFIEERRKIPGNRVSADKKYYEYEMMMRKLFDKRGIAWVD